MNIPWKTAWIIGASSGLGAEISRQLSEAGCKTYLSARRADKLEELCSELGNAIPVPVDITDRQECSNATNHIITEYGELPELIIINAAIYAPMNVETFDPQQIAKMMDVNYVGSANIIDKIIPHGNANKSVTLATVTSPSGWRGLPGGIGYGPSKAALINMIESVTPEMRERGFDMRLINPGFIKTRLTEMNDFEMPQLMEPSDAAKRAIHGLKSNKFDIAFPNPFILKLQFLRLLPYKLFFKITTGLLVKK